MKPMSPIDMIDAGASDDEPVKGVTYGHLRQWHDMFAAMSNLLADFSAERDETANKTLEDTQREHADEVARYMGALMHIAFYCEAEPQTAAQAIIAKLAREALDYPRAGAEPRHDQPELITSRDQPASRDDASGPNSEFDSRDGGQLADKLENLCCAETEGQFFDFVAENAKTIIAALRSVRTNPLSIRERAT